MSTRNKEYNQEVSQWLSKLWRDGSFEIRRQRGLTGSYTSACYRVTRDGEEMFLKQYNPLQQNGTSNEVEHYASHVKYGSPPMMPTLIARFPHETNEGTLVDAILIPFYHEEFKPESTLELLACILNLATLFKAFSDEGLIYFDLKSDALRLDKQGGLHLVDFTDLITPIHLVNVRRHLPVGNFESLSIPPEGSRYHEYRQKKFASGKVKMRVKNRILAGIKPEPYHVYSLAGLTLELRECNKMKDYREKLFHARGAEPGELSKQEQQKTLTLIRRMHLKATDLRPSLAEIRQVLWQILKPHLSNSDAGEGVARARKLLRTLTPEMDSLSGDVYRTLRDYWR